MIVLQDKQSPQRLDVRTTKFIALVRNMVLVEYLLGVFIVLLIVDFYNKWKKNALLGNIRGPIYFPLAGTIHVAYRFTPENFFQITQEDHKKYGKMMRLFVFNRLIIAMSDHKVVESLLSSQAHIKKNHLYDLLSQWLGDGLLLSEGQRWQTMRKIITPTFHFKILEQFVEILDQQSGVLVEQLEKHCDTGREFNVYPFICLAALDVITESAMGTKIHAQTDSNNEYSKAVIDITEIIAWRFFRVHLATEAVFKILCPRVKRRQDECVEIMHTFTKKVIAERRAKLENTSDQMTTNQSTDDEIGSKQRMAFLDVLLQSSNLLNDKQIREEVDTFMFEGHDTSTSAICFTLTLIARHPKVQQKIYQEICEVVGTDQTTPTTYRILQELKYTECVIKESLRMYPPVPIIGRQLSSDFFYEGGMIPAGSGILIGIWNMCNDPDVFPEPNVFRPERRSSPC